jgi:hypothetical protein
MLLLLGGCSIENQVYPGPPVYPSGGPPPLPITERVDRLVQVTQPVMDVLWVIDNSCSMQEEQDALVANFPAFIAFFDGTGLDFHVGVVSTDLEDPDHDGKLREADGARWLDPATADLPGTFAAMASLGTTGSGEEAGLGATWTALELRRSGYNAGFYREQGALHTVVISDERDATEVTLLSAEDFVVWYGGLEAREAERTFSSIVTLEGPNAGVAYLEATAALGGVVWDITDPDWATVLELLGIQAAGLRREFFLSARPVPETLEVAITPPEGVPTTVPTGEYVYDPVRNSVSFPAFLPAPLSIVEIRYQMESALVL